jgi:hypothetical protein
MIGPRRGVRDVRWVAVVLVVAVAGGFAMPAFGWYTTSTIWASYGNVYGRSETYLEPGDGKSKACVQTVLTGPGGIREEAYTCESGCQPSAQVSHSLVNGNWSVVGTHFVGVNACAETYGGYSAASGSTGIINSFSANPGQIYPGYSSTLS